jgi:signal transduction histidine kinase
MLKQVVNNLIFNAGRHTKDGEVVVSLERAGDRLVAAVADTGEGIDADILPRIFERGVSGDGATGYGLSICKAIVEMHGGEICIESGVGAGTTVRFSLPLMKGGGR